MTGIERTNCFLCHISKIEAFERRLKNDYKKYQNIKAILFYDIIKFDELKLVKFMMINLIY